MKLNVSITAGKISQDIVVHVGDGSQTFKWLALTASHRLVSDGARKGRHLPLNAGRHSLPLRTRLLPKDVYTANCPFLHPEDIINSHLSDEDTVNVDLYMPLEFDDFGAPILSKWAFIAFRHHEQHQEKREIFIEEKRQQVQTFAREAAEKAFLEKQAIEMPKIALMRKVMKKQVMEEEKIVTAMDGEWALIKDSGILDNVVTDHSQHDDIKQFLTTNFIEITDLYKFYSAINSGGGTHTLEYIELCKFVTETGILGEEDSSAVLKIFIDSHIRGMGGKGSNAKPSIHSQITQTEFFVALIKIAIYKKITVPKKAIAKLRRTGLYASNKKAVMPTVPAALNAIYTDHLLPVLTRMPAGSKMRNSLASNEVLLLLHDKMDMLSKAFELYSKDDDESSRGDEEERNHNVPSKEGAITCKQFEQFASDSGLLGGDEVIRRFSVLNLGRKNSVATDKAAGGIKVGVTRKDVRQIFAASQHDLEVTDAERRAVSRNKNADHHQELMVFSEFLEGICRIGVLKYGSLHEDVESEQQEKLSHYECIKLAITATCAVVKE